MQKSKAFKRLPNTHTKKNNKSRFGVRLKGSRNLGLTEGAEQSFVFWNGMCGKATGGARRYLSWLVTWSELAIVVVRRPSWGIVFTC